jgi:hypothetical protein
VYFLRAIVHDWPDDKAKQILKIIRDAAAPSSKLVVFDAIMPYACEYDGPFAEAVSPVKAPYPLLANLGMGIGGFVTWVDIQVGSFSLHTPPYLIALSRCSTCSTARSALSGNLSSSGNRAAGSSST